MHEISSARMKTAQDSAYKSLSFTAQSDRNIIIPITTSNHILS